ncbi:hypothetical protein ACIA8O_14380 [Kitasatospora sp. NPDC051853]|uniref:hypothetical protein n=1 Tax=Kitasatospora sp. NPDC051853 TaxID=3364058 RepID=UPI0037BA73E2
MSSDFRQICRWFIGEHEPGVHFDEPVTDFIEIVTFTDADEIVAVLEEVLAEDWARMPVWARNLAFRLAVLQRPHDADLLHTAGADLRCWGPTWHHIADEMMRRAGAMKEEQAQQRQEPNHLQRHPTRQDRRGREGSQDQRSAQPRFSEDWSAEEVRSSSRSGSMPIGSPEETSDAG